MTLWELAACRDGVAISNGAKPLGQELSDDDLRELGIAGF